MPSSHDFRARATAAPPAALLPLALLFLALVSSGFVLQQLSFALPSLLRDWRLSSPDLAAAFTLHLLGITVGAAGLGRMGQAFGPRRMLFAAALIQAIASLLCAAADTPALLGALRLLAGIGVGGMTPNAIALAAALSPPERRTRSMTLVLTGVAAGSSLPAIVVDLPLPGEDWRLLFLLGGGATLALAAVMSRWLPGFSALHSPRPDPHAQAGQSAGFRALFAGKIAWVTATLWIMYACVMLAMHMITSWLPVLLESEGLSPGRAAKLTGVVHLAGLAATLCSAMLLGWLGSIWLLLLMLVALASVAALATLGLASAFLALIVAGIGFGLVGSQGALGATAGRIYPTDLRPTGVGAAIAAGRIGSMAGPMAGGALQAAGVPSQGMWIVSMVALAAAVAAASVFTALGGDQPGGS